MFCETFSVCIYLNHDLLQHCSFPHGFRNWGPRTIGVRDDCTGMREDMKKNKKSNIHSTMCTLSEISENW